MFSRKSDQMLRVIRRVWMILMILLFYTILMVIAIAVLNMMTNNEETGSRTMLLDYSDQQVKRPKQKVKKFDDLFQIPRGSKKLLSHEWEKLPRVYTFSSGRWQLSEVCKPYKNYLEDPNFYLATSFSQAGSVKLFVHNPKYDAISGTIKQRRSFQSENVDFVVSMLRKDQELSLIDIGSHVGLYTMAAALLGRQVLAIDPVKQNIEHVCASVEYQNFTNKVSLVHNALTDSHGKVNFRHGGEGDFGLGHVDQDNVAKIMEAKFKNYFKNGRTIEVDAVKLDDILKLPRLTFFRKILIKMDVEGHEHRVLLGAKEFMKKKLNSVKGIIMEWQWVSGRQAENIILNLMSDWNFQPYRFLWKLELLNANKTQDWPDDVLWLPQQQVSQNINVDKLTRTRTRN